MRCIVIIERIWVKKSAVIVHSTSVLSDGSIPRLCISRMGGMPWRMFISIGTASETCAPTSLTLSPGPFGHPGHVHEQVVRPDADVFLVAALALRQRIHDRANAERRQDVRGDLQAELAPELP